MGARHLYWILVGPSFAVQFNKSDCDKPLFEKTGPETNGTKWRYLKISLPC